MSDEELKDRFDTIEKMLGIVAREFADNQRLSVEVIAHHMALQAAIREAVSDPAQRALLESRIRTNHQRAKDFVYDQLALWNESSAEGTPRDIPPILPDEPTNN